MTQKEAIIRKELEKLTDTHYEPQRTEDIDNAMEVIKQALTPPPTVDEVCKALRGELNWLIIYDEKKKSFCHIDTANLREIQAIYMRDNKLYVSQPLSPSTITLIGRFYEGLEVKE